MYYCNCNIGNADNVDNSNMSVRILFKLTTSWDNLQDIARNLSHCMEESGSQIRITSHDSTCMSDRQIPFHECKCKLVSTLFNS